MNDFTTTPEIDDMAAKRKRDPTEPPTAEEVKEARERAMKTMKLEKPMTQTEAATVVHAKLRAWQDWEGGQRAMPPGMFELFQIKTGQHRKFGAIDK